MKILIFMFEGPISNNKESGNFVPPPPFLNARLYVVRVFVLLLTVTTTLLLGTQCNYKH